MIGGTQGPDEWIRRGFFAFGAYSDARRCETDSSEWDIEPSGADIDGGEDDSGTSECNIDARDWHIDARGSHIDTSELDSDASGCHSDASECFLMRFWC